MKRPIFWLIFSCFTATSFLSYSMEKNDHEEQENIEETGRDLESTRQSAPQPNLYPALAIQTTNPSLWQKTLNYIFEDLQLISRQKFKKYLGSQLPGLLDVCFETGDFDEFFKEAATDLYKFIDKKKLAQLCLQLQARYLPSTVDNFIEDPKIYLAILIILDRAIESAENAIDEAAKQNDDSIWTEETLVSFIEWISTILNSWTHKAIKSYVEQFPDLKAKEARSKTKSKPLTRKIIAGETVEIVQDETNLVVNNHIKLLQRRVNQLERELRRARANEGRSNNIMLVHGAVVGIGSSYALSLLGRTICEPCVEYFEPDSAFTSFVMATLWTAGTIGLSYYIHNIKSLKTLITKLLADSASLSINTCFKVQELQKKIQRKTANPWQIFERSLDEAQIALINTKHQLMLQGVFNGNPRQIINFLEFYDACLKSPNSRKEAKGFIKFLFTLTPEQKVLFQKGLAYLKGLKLKEIEINEQEEGENEG